MAYPTLDYLTDLSATDMANARSLTFTTAGANTYSWDVFASVSRSDPYAILTETYKVNLANGGNITVSSTSYFDPFLIKVYDEFGNTVAASTTLVSSTALSSTMILTSYTAPYGGTFYIEPGWHQGSFYTDVSMIVAEDRVLPGNAGNDYITSSNVSAGPGNDWIQALGTNTFLRGDDGNDRINGSTGFDDLNGNRGDDTVYGGMGNDWVVGGQDNDLLYGEDGNDLVYGNLGNDTIFGDAGADWVRGGQGNDLVSGGDGNDWLWGDRGTDTLTGGAGADLFHSFSGAGVDRITDFSYAQGDRIILDDRTAYVVTQVGGDAVITIGGLDQVILVGVSASSLSSDAITYA